MKILIGVVLRPQGINGEIKITDLTDGIDAVKGVKKVYIDDTSYGVQKISARDNCLYLFLRGVFDRNTAELLRGKQVFADREEIAKGEDSYFIEDVIGCTLHLTSGKTIGRIKNVYSSNVDIFEVDTDEGDASFPFVKKLCPVVDIEGKTVTVDATAFSQVVCYKGGKDED
ncbi:MAG: 16S rRNA processing protein RimM [Clostridia bacterium]|nr:16S rRNA processing protein RimM [Clostridia bacterium]